jgi:hypothetical protein
MIVTAERADPILSTVTAERMEPPVPILLIETPMPEGLEPAAMHTTKIPLIEEETGKTMAVTVEMDRIEINGTRAPIQATMTRVVVIILTTAMANLILAIVVTMIPAMTGQKAGPKIET